MSEYDGAMRLALDQWVASRKPSGLLRYGFDILADSESEKATLSPVNLTRQAYTASVLADHHALTGDPRSAELLGGLLEAMRQRSLPIGKSPLQSYLEQARVLSLPAGRYKLRSALQRFGLVYLPEGPGQVVSPSGDYGQAYTGATALALISELRYSQASGVDRFADARRRWLAALIDLRIPGRGFRQVADSIDHDAYFDGEAWLALAEYHRAFGQDAAAAAALASADDDLLAFYGRQFRTAFFHWGTMAAAARYRDTKQPRFLAFVKTQMGEFLKARGERVDHDNNCALVEGVADGLAALALAGEGATPLAVSARNWMTGEMAKAEMLQIRPGQESIDYPNARVLAPRMRELAGDFLLGVHTPRTQVDMTAHCMSAMIKIRRGGLLGATR